MRRLKICMVTTFYPPYNFGGDGIFVYRLTDALARAGHTVHVIHNVDAYNALSKNPAKHGYPNHESVMVHPLTSGTKAGLDLLLTHQLGRPVLKRAQLRSLLESGNFDVIHFHNVSLMGGPHVLTYGNAVKLCTLHECWFVCPMHVLWRFDREVCTKRTCFACTIAGHRPPQMWRYTRHIDRSVRYVDAFVAPSQFTAEIYAANGFTAPIRRLPDFLPKPEVPTPSSELEGRRPFFLFVGRLEKIKGVQVLIEAFREYNSADLYIAGTGNYEPTLRQLAAGLEQIHFLGMLSHDRLWQLYQRAMATVVPSLCYESFGIIILESWSMGTPVVVHEVGALPEVVRDGRGGLTYKSLDELRHNLRTLQNKPDFRNQLGEQGYQSYMEHYTEEPHLKMYYELIAEIETAKQEPKS